ncbi:YaiI/YqxD family protein [Nitrincola tapanii]|uniref:UPF0178 protein E1H14_03595 n=1 Tax=Nitrincola tapanii TaxID=1708751 RepID=A0A5A9W5R0_9GAMM|nr:YaiI/YqxD family protein [Nitrincola tapanii]KAA0875784.1 YaiI/YqxD family protein [Nitrincola tapanii]
MTIWVDADACPVVVREILFRAAERTQIPLTLIANQFLRTPHIPWINMIQVHSGADEADKEIVRRAQADDLVITSDLPLANDALNKGAQVLTPRGEALTHETIRARLNMRDFLETLRASGMHSGGPASLQPADRKRFADQLDRWITQAQKRSARTLTPPPANC